MMTGQERRDHIKYLASEQVLTSLPEIIDALYDHVTCYAAMTALKSMGAPTQAGLKTFLRGNSRPDDVVQKLYDYVDHPTLSRAIPNYEHDFDGMPFCAFLAITYLATDDEYAEFLAWRNAQEKPLLTVVNIDDERSGSMLIRLMTNFQRNMMVVGEAPNAEAGGELVQRLQPDVIILDHMMPGLCGPEAIPYIRSFSPHSKIIFRTYRFGEVDILVQAIEAGADDVMSYGPFTQQELTAKIGQFLPGAKSSDG
jgi:CheY-like chemotaxis protein